MAWNALASIFYIFIKIKKKVDVAIDLYIIDTIGFVTLHALNLSLKYLILKIHIYSFDVYQFYLNWFI